MEKNNSGKTGANESCFTGKNMTPMILVMILVLMGGGFAYFKFFQSGYDRDQYTNNTSQNTSQALPSPIASEATIPADAEIKFKSAEDEVHAMSKDGMKTVANLYADLAFVKSAKQGTEENIVGLGDEDWLYSKTYDTTVIVCNHLNTPAHVFKGTTIAATELAKTKEMMQEALKMMPSSGESMKESTSTETGVMKETGYQLYSESLVNKALQEGQKVFVFFHASWCPNCIALEKNIKSNLSLIPANTLIVNADYDKETALKQKYGVTVQTTVVTLNSDGSLAKKVIGPTSLEEILN